MAIGIDFILRARTASFTQGLATANNAIKDLKKSVREFDVGGGFKQALGVGGVIAGFRLAINHAQELRDEAKKTGRAIDDSTRSVAEYGDAIGNIIAGSKNALVKGLSFFTQIGDAARRYFQDVTAEQEKAAQKMVETTGKAADEAEARLKKAREENSPEKLEAAEKKRAQAEFENNLKGTDAQKGLIKLMKERSDIEEELEKTGKATTKYKELQTRLLENETTMRKAQEAFDKEAVDNAKKKKEENEKANKETKKLVNMFAPTVEQLASQETGGFTEQSDPRLIARKILQGEEVARTLFERGDFKGGLAAAQKAAGMRESLENRTSETGMLTPKAAEEATKAALAETNTKLDGLTKAVQGIIKAQK